MGAIGALAVTLVICLLMGVPIAFSIGIATLAGLVAGGIPLTFIGQGAFTSLDSFTTLAIPMFILAGALMETGGLSKRLIGFAQSLIGNVAGGLGIVAVLACAFFAAISGSSPATVAAIGSIMIPAMIKRGYPAGFAASTSATAGGLGIVIPPSITMIVFGISANVSISDMFLAGIMPGILIVILLCTTIYLMSKKHGYSGIDSQFSFKNAAASFWDAKWALLAPVLILGGIYSGIFTPTESAMIAVVYGLIVGFFVYKELKLRDLPRILIESAVTTGAVVIILSTATSFGRIITMYQVPHKLTAWLTTLTQEPIIVLLLICLLMLILGTFMETLSLVIILTPILLPVVTALGIDPLHFGIIMTIGAEIGMITPPVGVNLFVASGISGLSIERLSKAMIPFLFTMLIAYALIALIPQLSAGFVHWIK